MSGSFALPVASLVLLAVLGTAAGAQDEGRQRGSRGAEGHLAQEGRGRSANEARWRSMDAARRERLARAGVRIEEMTPDERDQLSRRLRTLNRVRGSLQERLGREPDAEELRAELERVRTRAVDELEESDVSAPPEEATEDLLREVRQRTHSNILRYLNAAVDEGRVESAERDRLLALDHDELLFEAVRLYKRELLASPMGEVWGVDPQDTERVDELDLPRMLADLRGRRTQTYSRTQLSDDQRRRLEQMPEEEKRDARMRMMRENTRRALLEQGMDPVRVDAIAPAIEERDTR